MKNERGFNLSRSTIYNILRQKEFAPHNVKSQTQKHKFEVFMERKKTLPIQIGKITIGNKQPIAIQSMTNTKTKDVTATVKQILALEQIGCEIIRVAVLDMDDALALKTIKNQIHLPLVADIHFDYRLALASIEAGVDKLRINPGNIGSVDRIKMVVDACKRQQIPIRIGINAGSLEKDILKTPTSNC